MVLLQAEPAQSALAGANRAKGLSVVAGLYRIFLEMQNDISCFVAIVVVISQLIVK